MKRWMAFCLTAMLFLLCPITACAAVGTFREGTPQRESQLDAGYQTVAQTGEWTIWVQGHSVVAQGFGELPFCFVFSDMKTGQRLQSHLASGAFPVTRETGEFYNNWSRTVEDMTGMAYALFGDQVNFISYDNIPQRTGGNVYLFYLELWTEDRTQLLPVTMAWRFCDSYYVTLIGINQGDMPEMFEIAKDTAIQFADHTKKPFSGYRQYTYVGERREDLPEWSYPVSNPFWAVCEMLGV